MAFLPTRPNPAPLLAQIRAAQADLVQLRQEKEQCLSLIRQYDQLLQIHVGTLLTSLADLQRALATQKATQTRRRSDLETVANWTDATVNPTDTISTGSKPANAGTQQLPDIPNTPTSDGQLRKLYRKAATLAHPDRYAGNPGQMDRATVIMSQLNAAYEQKDIEAIQMLLNDLEDGLPFLDLPGQVPDLPTLERILARLAQTHDTLVLELAVLRNNESYRIMSDDRIDLTSHFAAIQQRCLIQIEVLTRQLSS